MSPPRSSQINYFALVESKYQSAYCTVGSLKQDTEGDDAWPLPFNVKRRALLYPSKRSLFFGEQGLFVRGTVKSVLKRAGAKHGERVRSQASTPPCRP